jgi:hypothetical protein
MTTDNDVLPIQPAGDIMSKVGYQWFDIDDRQTYQWTFTFPCGQELQFVSDLLSQPEIVPLSIPDMT